MGKLIIALALIAIAVFAYRNYLMQKEWELRFWDLKTELLKETSPERFELIKNEFNTFFISKGKYSESIHIAWKEFLQKYWKEYSELIKNEK